MRRLLPLAFLLIGAAPLLAQGDDEKDPFADMFGERQGGAGGDALPDDPLPRAKALMGRGRHDEAEMVLRGIVTDDAEDSAAWIVLGRLYLKTGRAKPAAEVGKTLRTLQNDKPAGHLFAGILAERAGQFDVAAQAFRNAITLSKGTQDIMAVESLVRLGELQAERDQKEAATVLGKVLAYYQAHDDLSPGEFVWVGRGCRTIDTFPDMKRDYTRSMADYSRRMFDQALSRDPEFALALVEGGELALSKLNTPAAKKAFEQALELDPNNARARVGLAQALVASFRAGKGKFGDATANLQKALAADPTNADAHAILAALAVTDGNFEQALERVETGLKDQPKAVSLLAVKAAVLKLRGDAEGFAKVEKALLAERPRCARFYHEVADLIGMKFRYAEARDMARRALAVNPGYHHVLSILGVNLTRTGDETEGRRVLKKAFKEDPYNVFVFNHLELWDRLDKYYEVIEVEGFTLRMHKDEAKLSRYAIGLLNEAKTKMGAKYGALPKRVLVEIFAKHEDFSARSVGLPGIPALGVCFGNVLTVLSSKEKKAVGAHSWGRTLWHEFAHVATLSVTGNRISRWFSEGLSVYEEPRGRKTWQREYDAEIMTLMARGLLLPIARLDEGFTKPKYPNQVMMSYYQAGMICEFMDARWGFPKIKELLGSFAKGNDTATGIRDVFKMEPEDFDGLFLDFLEKRYAGYAWLPAPGLADRQALLKTVEENPWNVGARGALARAYALHGMTTDAETHAGLALQHAEEAAGAWILLAGPEAELGLPGQSTLSAARLASIKAGAGDAYLALGIAAQRRGRMSLANRHLRRALHLGTRDPVLARRVRGSIYRAQKKWREAIREFEAAARLSPPNADLHRLLGACWKALGDEERSMAELRAVCLLDSEDAKARMRYAGWAKEKGRWVDAAEVLDDINMIDPFIPEAHLLLGDALRRTALNKKDVLERALSEYEVATILDVDYAAGALFGQAACLVALDRERPKALELVAKALDDDPDHKEARELKKTLEAELGPLAPNPEKPAPDEPEEAPEVPKGE